MILITQKGSRSINDVVLVGFPINAIETARERLNRTGKYRTANKRGPGNVASPYTHRRET